MTIGEKIRFYRELADMNQADLAQKACIPLGTLQKYEIDFRNPKPEPLCKIAKALNISPNVFLDAEHETAGDIASLFFLLARYADIEVHGEKTDGKYSPNDISFSFSHPLLQEFVADWANATESVRNLRKQAQVFEEAEIRKPMLASAETLERTLEYTKVRCGIKI